MDMTFAPWASYQLAFIFEWWRVETHTQFVTTWLFVVAASAAYHGLRYLITTLEFSMMKRVNKGNHTPSEWSTNNLEAGVGIEETFLVSDRSAAGIPSVAERRHVTLLRVTHALLSGLSYCLALLLMLAAMTYNPGIFVALVVGYAVGDYLFYARIAAVGSGYGAGIKGATGATGAAWSSYKHGNECH